MYDTRPNQDRTSVRVLGVGLMNWFHGVKGYLKASEFDVVLGEREFVRVEGDPTDIEMLGRNFLLLCQTIGVYHLFCWEWSHRIVRLLKLHRAVQYR